MQGHIRQPRNIPYKRRYVGCGWPTIKDASLEERCTFSHVSRLPMGDFPENAHGISHSYLLHSLYVWLRSANN
jgi:hypothetical protein